ncbi:aminotransferase, DegT/DnrJ/EryC1-family protein [Desulforapulum autotrophicum HRM2]|uniref:Aminotransferase, DegT/DnrJ/EryC1-family protein n=1 Tax=Desulforapulum autotrophicum (strain ATCC 43914 / DSM 3382 / VKM B-1955 / HRM2) TaxID=177437 RepID=C0QGG0_DESAH|nr:aminotransferase class I/II-fold pyridoxal phosphate-dependent enzyme [Desulforapulum autotrophicum]ACN13435.1 aminotransferase, DegT/DnrJ/EryC1-family protein [Desulforapulum autotrophicum HRM2]
MSCTQFTKDFTQQESIPQAGIDKALEIMASGKLHRYNTAPGEKGEAALLEEEFAQYMGKKYCLSCASCGSSMYLALKSSGVKPGDKVLCNAFTLAPVPGAIENSGAEIVLVDITDDYTIDLDDLDKKAKSSDVHWLLLSHMRGHIANMDRIMEICNTRGLTLIEDCAHTMGAYWDQKKSGSFGKVGCFSTQTYKHMNSGEGGLLVTDDPEVIARAIILSGSYMLYERHTSRPDMSVFESLKTMVPNYSCRMDNLRAALLRPQLADLDTQCRRWNERYDRLALGLKKIPGLFLPDRDPREAYVGSSIQFSLNGKSEAQILEFLSKCKEQGVELKWFGNKEPVGFTSAYESWKYLGQLPDLTNTRRILAVMCDMRIPLTFTLEDCDTILNIIEQTVKTILI